MNRGILAVMRRTAAIGSNAITGLLGRCLLVATLLGGCLEPPAIREWSEAILSPDGDGREGEPKTDGKSEKCVSWCAPSGPKECGTDGCGGTCGQCEHVPSCYESIVCQEPKGECLHGKLESGYCLIADECYKAGEAKQDDECLECVPEFNDAGWSAALGEPCGPEGFVCDASAVCCDRGSKCEGKQCGPDGCDGVCGVCEEPASYCNPATWQCQKPECQDPGPALWDGCQAGKIVEFQVNNEWLGDQREPAIAALPHGYVVVWQGDNSAGSADGNLTEVYARIFDDNGIGGEEFQANIVEEGQQTNPSVATLGNRLVVVWESDSSSFTTSQLMFRLFDLDEPLMDHLWVEG